MLTQSDIEFKLVLLINLSDFKTVKTNVRAALHDSFSSYKENNDFAVWRWRVDL